jgi:hypothetical protein
LLIVLPWDLKIDPIIGTTIFNDIIIYLCYLNTFQLRHLKRLFKDLFERQGFEDDGVFDWDLLKKQKEAGVSGVNFSPGKIFNFLQP